MRRFPRPRAAWRRTFLAGVFTAQKATPPCSCRCNRRARTQRTHTPSTKSLRCPALRVPVPRRTHAPTYARTHAPTHLRWDAGSVLARTLARSHARSRGACSYGAFPRPCERPLMRPALNAGNAPWLRTAPRTDEQAVDWVAGRWLAAACRHAGREPRRVETRHPWCALGGGHPAPAADGEWPPPAAGRGLALRHRGRRSGHAAPESGL